MGRKQRCRLWPAMVQAVPRPAGGHPRPWRHRSCEVQAQAADRSSPLRFLNDFALRPCSASRREVNSKFEDARSLLQDPFAPDVREPRRDHVPSAPPVPTPSLNSTRQGAKPCTAAGLLRLPSIEIAGREDRTKKLEHGSKTSFLPNKIYHDTVTHRQMAAFMHGLLRGMFARSASVVTKCVRHLSRSLERCSSPQLRRLSLFLPCAWLHVAFLRDFHNLTFGFL